MTHKKSIILKKYCVMYENTVDFFLFENCNVMEKMSLTPFHMNHFDLLTDNTDGIDCNASCTQNVK